MKTLGKVAFFGSLLEIGHGYFTKHLFWKQFRQLKETLKKPLETFRKKAAPYVWSKVFLLSIPDIRGQGLLACFTSPSMSLRGSKNCSYDLKFVDCKITRDQQHSTFDERIFYVHSHPMSYDNTSFLYFSVSGTALFAGICDHWKMKFIHWAFKNTTLVISFRVQQTFWMVFFPSAE